MEESYKPTCRLEWVRSTAYQDGKTPLAQSSGFPGSPPDWYCLKQLWVSDIEGEEDEWRDVECFK